MLAGKKGNVEDHCNLLCGMLLGFGMKAYVALGYSNQGEHAWVVTSGKDSLVFW
jgi:centrosomal protein CEP76